MTYAWTAQQRARLVPGATVVCDGQRATVARTAFNLTRDGKFNCKAESGLVAWSGTADPATLRPPTLAWLRKMARLKLGPCIVVREPDGCLHIYIGRADCHDSCAYFADTPHLDASSSCALWLHALPEVTP